MLNGIKTPIKLLVESFPGEDINLISDLIAATSIHSSIPTNIIQFFKARNFYYTDKPMVGFIPNMAMQLELVKAGKPLTGRKILNFSNAIKGDANAVVVDMWITRAFGLEAERGPTPKQYDAIEHYIQNTAPLVDLEPREFCASIWCGIRSISTGKRNLTTYDRYITKKLNQTNLVF